MMEVNSSTTTLTFTAPSLPDGVFIDTLVVMVTAVSILGIGSPSAPVSTLITGILSLSTVVLNSRDRQGMYGMQHFRTPRNPPYKRV